MFDKIMTVAALAAVVVMVLSLGNAIFHVFPWWASWVCLAGAAQCL